MTARRANVCAVMMLVAVVVFAVGMDAAQPMLALWSFLPLGIAGAVAVQL